MQPLIDLLPLLAFFVAYRLHGIYVATAVLMASMLLLVLRDWLLHRRISSMHAASTALVWVLGTLTLLLHNPNFLKWKPTIFLWAIGLMSVASLWVGRTPLAQRLMAPLVTGGEDLPRSLWQRLSWVWGGFFAALGTLNLYFAFRLSEQSWVNFKVFGLTAAFLVFSMAQALWLSARTETLTA
jgi:intracellular septation protein